MEQQNYFQSIDDEKPSPLDWNEAHAEVTFKDGQYYCEGLEGGFTSRAKMREAWRIRMHLRRFPAAEKELKAAIKDARKIRENCKESTNKRTRRINEAKREVEKWRNP